MKKGLMFHLGIQKYTVSPRGPITHATAKLRFLCSSSLQLLYKANKAFVHHITYVIVLQQYPVVYTFFNS